MIFMFHVFIDNTRTLLIASLLILLCDVSDLNQLKAIFVALRNVVRISVCNWICVGVVVSHAWLHVHIVLTFACTCNGLWYSIIGTLGAESLYHETTRVKLGTIATCVMYVDVLGWIRLIASTFRHFVRPCVPQKFCDWILGRGS